ncbi:MAG: phosphopantetheine-binding protein [Bacteroidales bacterium]|nr:phosphopantetheine-binding protein [Bacteroidales bacterium]
MTKEEIFNGLKEVIVTVKPALNVDAITCGSSLVRDLGIDSLSMLLLSLATENKFGFQFSRPEPFQTVGEVVDYIDAAINC